VSLADVGGVASHRDVGKRNGFRPFEGVVDEPIDDNNEFERPSSELVEDGVQAGQVCFDGGTLAVCRYDQ
jgi:hypothetical protein